MNGNPAIYQIIRLSKFTSFTKTQFNYQTLMSKKKKSTTNRKPLTSHTEITKTYSDEFTKTAHKFMRLFGLEPSAFDVLTKRTKQNLMLIKHTPYRVRAEKGSRVPRSYIQFFNKMMLVYEKETFYGDPIFNISYLEYVTFGMTLIFSLRKFDPNGYDYPLDQVVLLEKIKVSMLKSTAKNELDHFSVRTSHLCKIIFLYLSLPNYRYYTSVESGVMNESKGCMGNLITVSSVEPERKNFIIEGKTHSAYRLGYYSLLPTVKTVDPIFAEISLTLLEVETNRSNHQVMNQIKTNFKLPVYIQNHALRRTAERMDSVDNMYRSIIFSVSFTHPDAITALNGQRLIKARDTAANVVGYFPFIKQNGAVMLLSFLPLASPITPEGAILHKELGIQLEDSKYIGLDKLSFYAKTDFDTLPKLKQALKKANMWHLTQIEMITPTERKEDIILKNLFVKIDETSRKS